MCIIIGVLLALWLSEGPLGPGTGADNAGVGTLTWSNPGNITADDSSTASIFVFTTATTHWIVGTNFGFSIPSGATIDGVVVSWQKSNNASGNGFVVDSKVQLWDSGAIGSNKADTSTHWSAPPPASSTYGSSSDLWGATLTDTIVNGSGFGAALSGVLTGTTGFNIIEVDYVTITVYYTAGGGFQAAWATRSTQILTGGVM